jgi:hypothetical protein
MAPVVLVILLVLFTGLLWLLGLMCGRERRRYVADLSRQAMDAISALLHDPARSALGTSRPMLMAVSGCMGYGPCPQLLRLFGMRKSVASVAKALPRTFRSGVRRDLHGSAPTLSWAVTDTKERAFRCCYYFAAGMKSVRAERVRVNSCRSADCLVIPGRRREP